MHLFVGAGTSVAVSIFGDPCGLLLEALPFVHARARDQCLSAIRRVFNATAEQENVQIMLNLVTLNGPTLLAMVANVVRTESTSVLVILTGREVDSGLAGLLHASESVTSDADIRVQLDHGSSETDISSITGPSDAPPSSFGERGAGLAGLLRLARLLNASESVTGDAAIRVQLDHCSSEADTSSITLPPEAPPSSFGERGGGDQGLVENSNSATSRSVNEEPSGLAALLHASLVQLRRISQL